MAWSWEVDAVGFYTEYHTVFVVAATLYYPVIFGLRAALEKRDAFDLGGSGSKAVVNWIFWWELALAVFSIAGAVSVVPLALEPILAGKTWTETICMSPGVHDDPRSWWTFLFMVSKVFEFGDTLLVVLRKKPLILLQHYHHLATMLYCWYGTLYVYSLNNTNVFFAGMNLCVHSIMYSWYAATRTGWRSPKVFMMMVTLLQLLQMLAGCAIVAVSVYGGAESGCGRWAEEDPVGLGGCAFMYASYAVLFGKLFVGNYLSKEEERQPGGDKKQK
eukprot:TRINITY_DN5325_c0_g1_i3.p2 TRINITY_DN5325_c0_g1~~TRINITY_DN5325_c0_g1_i3.p2  ORF type:complete len:274 (-),score=50.66 TRINITY_DN5325_c0_g1_i3:266-1087(-)